MQDIDKEIEFAKFLYKKGYLPGPKKCDWCKDIFNIQKGSSCKTSGCIFRCSNYACRKKFSIRKNSIFELFPYIPLLIFADIISCFMIKEFNIAKAYEFLNSEKNYVVSTRTIRKIYNKLRDLIINYLNVVYDSELLGEENKNGYFAVDESLFGHVENKQFWLLGIINNEDRDFRI